MHLTLVVVLGSYDMFFLTMLEGKLHLWSCFLTKTYYSLGVIDEEIMMSLEGVWLQQCLPINGNGFIICSYWHFEQLGIEDQ